MDRLLLMTVIDLSNNRLRSLDGCNMLQSARKICLDNNNLEVIVNKQCLNLPYLKELSLNNNSILWSVGKIQCLLILCSFSFAILITNLQNYFLNHS